MNLMRSDFENLDLQIDLADECGIANAPWNPSCNHF
jgi:hypothetical protein